AYAAENADFFWTFSWRRGQAYQTQYPELNNAADALSAAANQMVYLLRTRGGRPDMPIFPNIFPHPLYSHLVLADHLGQGFPWKTVISSGDENRRRWADDPACFDQGCFLPLQPNPDPSQKRWPYSASFQTCVAFYDRSPLGYRLNQVGNPYNLY